MSVVCGQTCLGNAATPSELVLRGVFLARQKELDWLYSYGASEIMAEAWDDFVSVIPENERGELIDAFYRKLTADDEATRLEAARAWSVWEGQVATLLPKPELVEDYADAAKALPMARISARFFREKFWLEENQLLRDVGKLKGIPGIIVQGRHDICTPPTSAWELKKAWPQVELWIVHDAGHSASETGIIDASLPSARPPTLYASFGDWMLLALILASWSWAMATNATARYRRMRRTVMQRCG